MARSRKHLGGSIRAGCKQALKRAGVSPGVQGLSQAVASSGDAFQPLLGQIARHDGDRDRQRARGPAKRGDQRPRPRLFGPRPQHQDPDRRVFVHLRQNLGDIVGNTADAFKLSYLENALTSNPVLNKMAGT